MRKGDSALTIFDFLINLCIIFSSTTRAEGSSQQSKMVMNRFICYLLFIQGNPLNKDMSHLQRSPNITGNLCNEKSLSGLSGFQQETVLVVLLVKRFVILLYSSHNFSLGHNLSYF